MAILEQFAQLSLTQWLILIPTLVVAGHIFAWVVDPHRVRSYPGPLLAKFSDAWLGYIAAHGHRSEVVHKMHEKYGESSLRSFLVDCA
jgi:benzoate 4-monooxygenase